MLSGRIQVHAGSISTSGLIEVRVSAVGHSTLFGQVTNVVRYVLTIIRIAHVSRRLIGYRDA